MYRTREQRLGPLGTALRFVRRSLFRLVSCPAPAIVLALIGSIAVVVVMSYSSMPNRTAGWSGLTPSGKRFSVKTQSEGLFVPLVYTATVAADPGTGSQELLDALRAGLIHTGCASVYPMVMRDLGAESGSPRLKATCIGYANVPLAALNLLSILVASSCMLLLILRHYERRWLRHAKYGGLCVRCGYDLSAVVAEHCPECGEGSVQVYSEPSSSRSTHA